MVFFSVIVLDIGSGFQLSCFEARLAFPFFFIGLPQERRTRMYAHSQDSRSLQTKSMYNALARKHTLQWPLGICSLHSWSCRRWLFVYWLYLPFRLATSPHRTCFYSQCIYPSMPILPYLRSTFREWHTCRSTEKQLGQRMRLLNAIHTQLTNTF
jgi:hypothetical protein